MKKVAPRVAVELALLALALSSSACEALRSTEAGAPSAPPLPLTHAAPARSAVDSNPGPLVDFPVIPPSRARERCPDDVLPRGASESTLAVRVHDVRSERRELLPLDVVLALESGVSGSDAPRYVADLLIDVYSNPRLFRRLDAPHSEWAAGKLEGRLVIRDRRERRALCQVPVRVRGNAADAPISRRLREATRAALEHKLERAVNDELRVALASISGVLRLGEPGSAGKPGTLLATR